ncbi:MAG: hypothetical protein ISEC1_P0460 [Thiomicrorhabdus sp.]|nr:MAG: hypothetical protein ISEC1_P0460 [Thiomicrorhabdus sp.]
MAKIIPFPESAERQQLDLERIIDHALHVDDPDLKACIKVGLTKTMSEYQGIPAFEFHAPIDLSEADLAVLSESLSAQYNEHVTDYAYSLIGEICKLNIEICQLKSM